MWTRAKRVLASLALGLALFVCVWVSRVFFAGQIVGPLIPLTGLIAIASITIIAGAVPTLPLGFGYGLMRHHSMLGGAIVVVVLACIFELATSSAAVSWWKFKTWWVLPLECLTVLIVFLLAALAGSRSLQGVVPVVRFRIGAGLIVLITVGALCWPWLYSCIHLNVCRLVP